jgi:hypothetical protein
LRVTPGTAGANNSANAQVIFTATGTFSLPPTPAPVTFAVPYSGQFVVDNPTNSTIATVFSSRTGTDTVTGQCATGASGTVPVVASASANNGSTIVVSGSAQLTWPRCL